MLPVRDTCILDWHDEVVQRVGLVRSAERLTLHRQRHVSKTKQSKWYLALLGRRRAIAPMNEAAFRSQSRVRSGRGVGRKGRRMVPVARQRQRGFCGSATSMPASVSRRARSIEPLSKNASRITVPASGRVMPRRTILSAGDVQWVNVDEAPDGCSGECKGRLGAQELANSPGGV